MELFEKCAAADYAEAYAEIIILLAAEFENGENAKRCLQLYPKATAGRVDLARLLIGNLYYNGSLEGGEKKALEFYILASDKNETAAANAAKMYARAQNFEECFKYLRKAATLGDTESMRVYAYACIVGDIKDFDPREVLGLVETLVENEIDGALYLLGLYHEAGVAGSADIDSAMKAYSAGAEKSDANCQFKMGWFLTTGDGGVKKNEESGVKYYKAAYAQNHIPAAMNLGGCYMQGIGVEKDEKKAFELWKQCAALGDETARINVIACYQDGLGVEKDLAKAIALTREYALENNARAQYEMGEYKLTREGFIDMAESLAWYRIAMKNGFKDAEMHVGILEEQLSKEDIDRAAALQKSIEAEIKNKQSSDKKNF